MKIVVLFILFIVLVFITTADNNEEFCTPQDKTKFSFSAKYGGINAVEKDLRKYIKDHISTSMQYLLISSYFGNYKMERHGFRKLFRKLSDEKWNDVINLIEHITRRGGSVGGSLIYKENGFILSLNEIGSLSKALDIEKSLSTQAFKIHHNVTRVNKHDPEIGHYLEEKFIEKHAKQIRELSGYSNDLKNILSKSADDSALAIFIFDEYLNKNL